MCLRPGGDPEALGLVDAAGTPKKQASTATAPGGGGGGIDAAVSSVGSDDTSRRAVLASASALEILESDEAIYEVSN